MKRLRGFKTICAALALISPVAMSGTVDDYFDEGVLGLKWGATLAQVQEKFPGGVTYPSEGERGSDYIAYQVAVESKATGIELPPALAILAFTKSGNLRGVSFHFNYADRDTVLFQVAGALGQNYSSRDAAFDYKYRWKSGHTSSVALSIGRAPPHTWVYLSVWADSDVQSQRP